MQVYNIPIDDNFQETTKHGSNDFPVAVYTDKFELFKEGHIKWHWHKELQLSYVLKGSIDLTMPNENISLSCGEGIFINSNVLHQIKPHTSEGCMMFSIVFKPDLIGGSPHSLISKKYLNPIIMNSTLKNIKLSQSDSWNKEVLHSMNQIFINSKDKPFGYELDIKFHLCKIWMSIINNIYLEFNQSPDSHDDERLKKALTFIHNNYHELITHEDISVQSNISKSECCRCFKRLLNMTPFEYLMEYRVSMASELLIKESLSISQIAFSVGFNGTSYFTKTFKKYMQYTPSKYRKIHKKHSR